jgi:hypothetical protein
MKKQLLAITISMAVFCCDFNRSDTLAEKVTGVYVREHTFEVTHIETGNVIGLSTIRDTIFISPKDDKFEIVNNKWRLNDYDNEGWKNQFHAEDRSMPVALATYNSTDHSLNLHLPGAMPFYIDIKNKLLKMGRNNSSVYKKIN